MLSGNTAYYVELSCDYVTLFEKKLNGSRKCPAYKESDDVTITNISRAWRRRKTAGTDMVYVIVTVYAYVLISCRLNFGI